MNDLLLRGAVHAQVLIAQSLPEVPNPGPKAPPGIGEVGNTLISWLKWGAVIAGVIIIVIGALTYGAAKASGNPKAQGGAARAIGAGAAVVFIAMSAAFWVSLAQWLGNSVGG